jgi:hypothetical protein
MGKIRPADNLKRELFIVFPAGGNFRNQRNVKFAITVQISQAGNALR